jgi:hypothetical protein
MAKMNLIILLASSLLVACSEQDPVATQCGSYFSEMIEQLHQIKQELAADNVCFECIKEKVKKSGGISDLSRKMTNCSIDGAYDFRTDSLVSSVDKRVDNIIYEIDWLDRNRNVSRYFKVIEDRIEELKPTLREMISLRES